MRMCAAQVSTPSSQTGRRYLSTDRAHARSSGVSNDELTVAHGRVQHRQQLTPPQKGNLFASPVAEPGDSLSIKNENIRTANSPLGSSHLQSKRNGHSITIKTGYSWRRKRAYSPEAQPPERWGWVS